LESPAHDLALAFIWLPFALAAEVVAGDADRLRWLVAATLLLSFAHQPLTLWLAYGDAGQRRAHLALFAWAPLVVAVAVGLGSALRPELVALVAGVWNVAHTIRQRYGVSRLYGRLSGIDCAGDNRLLWSWLSVAVLVALARTDLGDTARDIGLAARHTRALDALTSGRATTVVLLPVAVAIAAFLTTRAVRDEWRRPTHSPARVVYLGSTALLLAVLAIAPVVGFVAYVGSHAVEYLLMVRWRVGRAAARAATGDRVGALGRRIGRDGTIALYAVAVIALVIGIRMLKGSDLRVIFVLTVGALHFLYDGVLWRSPKPVDG
jgi:hypothetical protein